MIRPFRAALALLILIAAPAAAQTAPQAAVEALLAADRAFAAAAANAPSALDGIAPMLDAEVSAPIGGSVVTGRDAVLAAFRANPAFREGHATWAPIRGGISADGTQGFTFGYLSITAGDPARRNRKYLAYWIRRSDGWRAIAYRQIPRAPGEVSNDMLPPSLPGFTAAPVADPAVIAAHEQSVATAERAFSDRAQVVGLRTAFRENGREDAMNMYEGATFRVGLDAITAGFPENETTATIHWSTTRAIAASSGDLGVSIGMIRPHVRRDGQPEGAPFFTIWRRDAPDQPWRYIAE